MKKVTLGSQGLIVPTIGLGCMGMTGFEEANMYGKADEQEAMATIHRIRVPADLPPRLFIESFLVICNK